MHSDLATEPHLTNGLNGLKNFLMDVPGYLRLYSVEGGNQRVTDLLRRQLNSTHIEINAPVTRVERNADGYRVSFRRADAIEREDFDAVFIALPHNSLSSVEWGGEGGDALRKAMDRFIAYYDRPGHYLRVTILFRKPFWREQIQDSWFMLDAFGGCCAYDESARHDAGPYGVLNWLIAGTDALSLSNSDDEAIAQAVLNSLPKALREEARPSFMEARVHRWMASVNGQPGGLPARDTRSAHLPEPKHHPGLFAVGDYLFDSTINGVLDSADFATDFFQSWLLRRDREAIAATKPSRLDKSYFDYYDEDLPYEDSYNRYFDAKYVRDLIRIVWKVKPPYRLLDAGSASGLTLKDFSDYGIKAWGVENNKYIHSQTPSRWRKRNLLGDVRKLPFPNEHFDFVYETCLVHTAEDQLGAAIREFYRVCRRGVVFASLTSDMNPELFRDRDMLMGARSLMPLWEWGELFTANGFAIAASDEKTLERLWRAEEKSNEGDVPWYPDRESMRYCFYTKV